MEFLEVILIIIFILLSLMVISFIIMVPIRVYRKFKSKSKSQLINLYHSKVRAYAMDNDFNLNEISFDEISFDDWNSIETLVPIYTEMYRRYDPQYREEVINALEKIDD